MLYYTVVHAALSSGFCLTAPPMKSRRPKYEAAQLQDSKGFFRGPLLKGPLMVSLDVLSLALVSKRLI